MNTLKTILYMGSLHGFFTIYLPYRIGSSEVRIFHLGISAYLAIPLWIMGIFIIVRCSIDIVRKGHGTPAHLAPPRTLVIHGPYHHVRNPIYLGALLVLSGYIVWFGSGLLVVYFLFFILAFHMLIVLIEEPVLEKMFGEEYDEYRQNVPRWIPRFK